MKVISKVIAVLLLFFLFLLFLIVGINMLQYSKWRESFNGSVNEEYLSMSVEDLSEEVQIKISNFVNSEENTDFMEFTISEFAQILDYSMNSNIEGLDVEKVYIEPAEGNWKVYLKGRVESFNLPWICLDIVKDDIESAEFYVKYILVGDTKLPKVLESKLVGLVNEGIREAILLFNENLFSKRYLQNISLFEDKVVIKGILY